MAGIRLFSLGRCQRSVTPKIMRGWIRDKGFVLVKPKPKSKMSCAVRRAIGSPRFRCPRNNWQTTLQPARSRTRTQHTLRHVDDRRETGSSQATAQAARADPTRADQRNRRISAPRRMRQQDILEIFTAHVDGNGPFPHARAPPFIRTTNVNEEHAPAQRRCMCVRDAQRPLGPGLGRQIVPARRKHSAPNNRPTR